MKAEKTRPNERSNTEHIHLLSQWIFGVADAASVEKIPHEAESWNELWLTAQAHHVTIRAGTVLEGPIRGMQPRLAHDLNFHLEEQLADLQERIQNERTRTVAAIRHLHAVCEALAAEGISTVVIKSLDHWPDFGSDIDLFTDAPEARVSRLMKARFDARIVSPSLSDRIAAKVNYRLPHLDELIEVHFGRLGQTGEHVELAKRVLLRQQRQAYCGASVPVPAVEERIVLATLQRMYRHFFIRIADIENTRRMVEEEGIDFDELRHASKRAGIWPGTATYLKLCSQYVEHYRGRGIRLPRRVMEAARFGIRNIYPHAGFPRLPLFPQAASLYVRQLAGSMRRDPANGLRLSLLPPLAAAAGMKYRLTGSDKGLW